MKNLFLDHMEGVTTENISIEKLPKITNDLDKLDGLCRVGGPSPSDSGKKIPQSEATVNQCQYILNYSLHPFSDIFRLGFTFSYFRFAMSAYYRRLVL